MNKKFIIADLILILICTALYFILTSRPIAREQEITDVAEGSNSFAFSLYSELRNNEGNLFFSPIGISNAFAMVYAGARGDTETVMKEVMEFPLEQNRLHPAFAVLMRNLMSASEKNGGEFLTANSIWGREGFSPKKSFTKSLKKYYRADYNELDFDKGPEDAARTINAWVGRKTRGIIRQIVTSEDIDAMTQLIVVNAVYFKGMWASEFDPRDTREEEFYLQEGGNTLVPMMRQEGEFRYFSDDEIKVLEMSYANGRMTMMIFLPHKIAGLAEFEKSLTAGKIDTYVRSVRMQKIEIQIPRFRMTSELALTEALKAMGMGDAFHEEKAEFSGITDSSLSLSTVLHNAYISVDEEGTEAAAATGVIMKSEIKNGIRFIANHPFMMIIRDYETGCIMFMGRVMNPTE